MKLKVYVLTFPFCLNKIFNNTVVEWHQLAKYSGSLLLFVLFVSLRLGLGFFFSVVSGGFWVFFVGFFGWLVVVCLFLTMEVLRW